MRITAEMLDRGGRAVYEWCQAQIGEEIHPGDPQWDEMSDEQKRSDRLLAAEVLVAVLEMAA